MLYEDNVLLFGLHNYFDECVYSDKLFVSFVLLNQVSGRLSFYND